MKYSTIIFILIILVSCQNEESGTIIKDFPQKKFLESHSVLLYNLPLIADKIITIDSFLVIQNTKDPKADIFFIYNKNNKKFLGSFGRRGGGPNEFTANILTISGQFENVDNSTCIWVRNGFWCKLINLNKSISENKTIIEKKIKTPRSLIFGKDIFILPNNKMFGTSMSSEGRFFNYNLKTKKMNWVEFFPKVKTPHPDYDKHNVYTGPLRINNSGSTIVSALTSFKRIDIFNQEAKLKHSIIFEDSPKDPDFQNRKNTGTFMLYYLDAQVTEQFIYALNLNAYLDDLVKEDYTTNNEIHVFTIEGKPIISYKLDTLIDSFTVDEENKCIWATKAPISDKDEPQVVCFKIETNL